MKVMCPECGLENEVVEIPGGFYFDQVEYKCSCGYYITTFALNYTQAKEDLKQQTRKDVMLALGTESKEARPDLSGRGLAKSG